MLPFFMSMSFLHPQILLQPWTVCETCLGLGRKTLSAPCCEHRDLMFPLSLEQLWPAGSGALGLHICYKETRWLGMHKQAGTRAGNHHRHTQQTPANSAFCNAFQFRLGLSPRPMHAPRVRCGCGALVDPPPGSPEPDFF